MHDEGCKIIGVASTCMYFLFETIFKPTQEGLFNDVSECFGSRYITEPKQEGLFNDVSECFGSRYITQPMQEGLFNDVSECFGSRYI